MGCGITLLGVIVPRVLMVVWWLNDPDRWQTIFGGILWPALGFVFLPWTTLWYVVFQPTGFELLTIVLLVFAVLIDLGTWGIGAFAGRKQVSYYRDR